MPKTPITRALCFAALLALAGAAVPAQASHDGFLSGGAFRVGHFNFSILLGDPGGGSPYGYYYRTPDRLAYHGHHCSSACLVRGGYAYHHETCPLVLRHLAYNRFDPFDLHYRFAPPHPVWFSHRFDRRLPHHWHNRGRFDPRDRFDRNDRDRHHGRDRFDRNDRDRHHGRDRFDRNDRDRNRGRDRYDRPDRDRNRGQRYDRDDNRRDRGRDRDRGDRRDRRPRRPPGRN